MKEGGSGVQVMLERGCTKQLIRETRISQRKGRKWSEPIVHILL
jgi:hypothetical protein